VKRINVFNLIISSREEINLLNIKLNKIGLFIKTKKERLFLWFNNKEEELIFIKLKTIEFVLKPESLLNLI